MCLQPDAISRLERYITIAMIILYFILFFIFGWTEAYADIYKYVTEDGVACYTDAPSRKDAVMILREARPARKSSAADSAVSRQQNAGKVKDKILQSLQAKNGTSDLRDNLPVPGRITSPVGMRNDPIDGVLRLHNGVDIAVATGTPVKPVAAGTIFYSGNRSGYGNMVIVEHLDGMRTVYAHNSVNLVTTGQQIERDSTIALSGSTGRSTGPHLHFEAWKDDTNITSAVLGYGDGEQFSVASRNTAHKNRPVRTAILPDGSLLFTNLP
jgi:murein DD-endopeptidase MepM/ murein hydrolase activator NlpD